jgi:alpha-1,3-rhamnosyltransferase
MNINAPLVSVIVPSYNHERFVPQTLHSILNQTYKNIELIVIDDGSTDGSHAIIEEWRLKHNFTFERKANQGLPATLNQGLKYSKGKYLAICASDDYWLLDKIEKQVEYMEKNPNIIACAGNILNVNAENEVLPFYLQGFSQKKAYSFYDFITFSTYCPAVTVLYRTDSVKKIGFDNKYKIEDRYLWLKLTQNQEKIILLPQLLAFYRVHETNTTKRNRFMLDEKLKLLSIYKGETGYRKGVIKSYLQYYFHILLKWLPLWIFPFKRG